MSRIVRLIHPLSPLLVLMIASISHAFVMITIENETVLPGGTALVAVFASSDSSDVISGFNLPYDINSDGYVDSNMNMIGDLPTGFTLDAAPVQNVIYGNTMFDMPQPQIALAGVDAIPSGNESNVTLSTTPTKLFDVVYNVAPSVPVGTIVPLRILIPAGQLSSLFNVAGPNTPLVSVPSPGVPTLGSITVVPEPGGFLLIFAVGSICISWLGVSRWWRHRCAVPVRSRLG